jgi:hypothetical protein
MFTPLLIVLVVMLVATSLVMWSRAKKAARVDYIRTFFLPKGLYAKLLKHHPHLSEKDCQLVGRALRQFFITYAKSDHRAVAMPSQVTDDLWHEFILYTRDYDEFCKKSFGRFFHHTPAIVIKASGGNEAGLRRCWWHACAEENINPRKPQRLPILFAIDKKLNIVNGFFYSPDCKALGRTNSGDGYCASDFSDGSLFTSDLSFEGFGDFGGDGGGDGCGGGCGGD